MDQDEFQDDDEEIEATDNLTNEDDEEFDDENMEDGNDEFEVEGGEKTYVMYLYRPTWSRNSDFATERGRLADDKRKKIEQMREERRRY